MRERVRLVAVDERRAVIDMHSLTAGWALFVCSELMTCCPECSHAPVPETLKASCFIGEAQLHNYFLILV